MFPPTHIPIALPADKVPTKRMVRDIIATFLPLEWPSVDPESLHLSFKADFTNPQCIVSRPLLANGTAVEPVKVFIKFLNSSGTAIDTFTHLTLSKEQEATLCHEYSLSERRQGAKVYGLFQTQDGTIGRIDEFLDARNLMPADVEDAGIRADIATSMAQFHALKTSVPRNEVAAFYDALIPALRKYHKMEKLKVLGREGGVSIDDLIDYDFTSRLKVVVAALEAMGAKARWCLHDVQFMNTMVKNRPQPGESRVALIDFELAMRNYRAFDIGGHFMQKMFQWFDEESRIARCRPYSEDEMRHFCDSYAREWNRSNGDEDTKEQVLKEADLGYLLAISFEVHNMLWFMAGNEQSDPLDLEALIKLFEEFEGQYRKLNLQAPNA